MITVVILSVLAIPAFFIVRWDARRRPYAPCPKCRGHRGRNSASPEAWGRCSRCGGSGERRRLLAVLFGAGGAR